VLTEVGPVEIDVPRDRDGSFEPKIVAKRQRRSSPAHSPRMSRRPLPVTASEAACVPVS